MKGLSALLVCFAAAAPGFAQAEPQAGHEPGAPVIRVLDFKGFQPIKIGDILQNLKAKGVRLAAEVPLDPQVLETAKKELEGQLAENGRPGAHVKVDIKPMPPRSVKVIFTAVKP